MVCEPSVRYSIRHLELEYQAGNKQPLEDLWRAFIGIKQLPPTDDYSFFRIGALHGAPFLTDYHGEDEYWGGYCHHQNILFPTWHRAYVNYIEKALQSIVPGVMLPFWDSTSPESLQYGLPQTLTRQTIILDDEEVPNPLLSYVLQQGFAEENSSELYRKPLGYETVRYPLSGLVGHPIHQAITTVHNNKYPDHAERVRMLNENLVQWLDGDLVPIIVVEDGEEQPPRNNINTQYADSMKAPNYTVYSNATSASEWNENHDYYIESVESPHGSVHLAIGGFDSRLFPQSLDDYRIAGIETLSNGDMGENETAGFDPIFFFHHCNVDRMFWAWQKKWNQTQSLTVNDGYPGTTIPGRQGFSPGFTTPGEGLNLDSPLYPFLRSGGLIPEKADGSGMDLKDVNVATDVLTSADLINIQDMKYAEDVRESFNFDFQIGSFDSEESTLVKATSRTVEQEFSPNERFRKIFISGINRALISGSFIIAVYANVCEKFVFLGYEAVLSRWNVMSCENCRNHLTISSNFRIPKFARQLDIENIKSGVGLYVQFISRVGGSSLQLGQLDNKEEAQAEDLVARSSINVAPTAPLKSQQLPNKFKFDFKIIN